MSVAVKFCGLGNVQDAMYFNEIHPDYAGLVFWPKSRRAVTRQQAKILRRTLDSSIETVGVFVDENPQVIIDLYKEGVISIAQLHGTEDDSFIELLHQRAGGLKVWRAFEVKSADDIACAQTSRADGILLDAGKGAGTVFDWSLLSAMRCPFGLAGGLTAENIASALASVPTQELISFVDVSSGIEESDGSNPPRKSREKMQRFMSALGRKGGLHE